MMAHASHATGPGSVVLDIGGDRGALVVYAPPTAIGREIEIRRRGRAWAGDHVAVRGRAVGARPVAAALFGPLEAGSYQVRWRRVPGGPELEAEVRAGLVGEVTLAPGPPGDPDGGLAP